MAGTQPKTEALDAVRSLAESAANQRGASFVGSDLRLFEGVRTLSSGRVPGEACASEASSGEVGAGGISSFDLGRTYEVMLAPEVRRRAGAHLTPATVARGLVELMGPPGSKDRVLDPAVGGAAFLLVAADQLVAAGAAPAAALGQLAGMDIDPGAVAVAEAALALWALDHELDPIALDNLVIGDGLLDELPTVARVVGNPPFLNQLRSSSSHTAERRTALRERWGELVGAYTDDAWLFLAAGLDTLGAGGVLAMVQPVSILAARHGDGVRQHVTDQGQLRALWLARDKVFDASVQVCGIVATRDRLGQTHPPVRRAVGADFARYRSLRRSVQPDEWGSAAAATVGVPEIRFTRAMTSVGDLAGATAGFRDQFYGFVPHVYEAPGEGTIEQLNDRSPLVTVGMIEPFQLGWGERVSKFAGQSYRRPAVSLDAVEAANPTLGRWVHQRLRPKLLMATQTKIAEVWVDRHGLAIPVTPVLSIEPLGQDEDTLWLLAAALSSPAMSAHFLASRFGTAMSLNAMKLAARDIASAPLPSDRGTWQEAANTLRREPTELAHFGTLMGAAYGVESPDLVTWWIDRLPKRAST